MATPFETLVGGDVIGGVLQAYTDVTGEWLYVVVFMGILAMIYYKTKNPTTVSLVGLIVGSALIASNLFTPEGIAVLQSIVIISVAGSLWGVFKLSR